MAEEGLNVAEGLNVTEEGLNVAEERLNVAEEELSVAGKAALFGDDS